MFLSTGSRHTAATLWGWDYGVCWFVCLNIDVVDERKSAEKSVGIFFRQTTYVFPFLSRYKLIRRRVIWLIGQWISVKFKSDLRPLLYEVILSLMQDPDLVVSQKCTFSSPPLIMTGTSAFLKTLDLWRPNWTINEKGCNQPLYIGQCPQLNSMGHSYCAPTLLQTNPSIVNQDCKTNLPIWFHKILFQIFLLLLSLFSFCPDKALIQLFGKWLFFCCSHSHVKLHLTITGLCASWAVPSIDVFSLNRIYIKECVELHCIIYNSIGDNLTISRLLLWIPGFNLSVSDCLFVWLTFRIVVVCVPLSCVRHTIWLQCN